MDTLATPEPNPGTPGSQNIESPAPAAGPQTWKEWLAANSTVLMFIALAIAFIIWKGLDPLDLLKVAIGLGLVIFIHELGHFLAAKWCDVHVETFSIGFGKALPGCQFKYGETTYKIGWIPLGGFVKMVGEGENADSEDAEEDPRSFKHKSVPQRMLIISAGVFMNIVLAWVCFIVVYSHGVEEQAPIVGWVDSGSPAWRDGLHSGANIVQIDSLKKPVFGDVRPIIMSTDANEKVLFVLRDGPNGEPYSIWVEPTRGPDALFPMAGFSPADQLTLIDRRRGEDKPFEPGSPAAASQPPFHSGDRVIACSNDPADYKKVVPLPEDKRDGVGAKLDYFEFEKRLHDMRGRKMIVRVQRGGTSEDITVEPAYYVTTGMRMRMGRVAAIRQNSPAAHAKSVSESADGGKTWTAPDDNEIGMQTCKVNAKEISGGDQITQVEVWVGEKSMRRWAVNQKPGTTEENGVKYENLPLDPLRLPYELEQWAEGKPFKPTVRMTVLRPTIGKGPENKYVKLEMEWDPSAKYYQEVLTTPNSPLSIPCLGLAYYVDAIVEAVDGNPAAEAKIQKDDLIKEIRYTPYGKKDKSKWIEIKSYQWAHFFMALQHLDPKELDLKIDRGGVSVDVTLKGQEDEKWAKDDRGLIFQVNTQQHKADGLIDALGLGVHRTFRIVHVIYQNLYAMLSGRVSPLTMSGPLTIADVSYKIAGENIWQFILFIGMINVNLAVVNFLPVPVLDGGHMVFLIYEKIRGKPAPEAVLAGAMYTGLALILALMCFVLFLDTKRLFF